MKEVKGFFRKGIEPEKEWEAKYITEQNKTNRWTNVVSAGLFILFLSIIFISLNLYPCEAEFEGSISGVFDLNENISQEPIIEDFLITNSNGKVKISGTCTAVSLFSMRGY